MKQVSTTSKSIGRVTSSIMADIKGDVYELDIKTNKWIYTGNVNDEVLKLNHKVPLVAFDEVTVTAKNEGMIDIIFSQTTDETAKQADVVAAIRCANTEQLKGLIKTINDTLKKESEREP